MIEIILASQSPRRHQFFRDLGLPFSVLVADIDESPLPDEEPVALARRLAEGKAQAVARRLATESSVSTKTQADETGVRPLVVAADTVVAQGFVLLGKPVDRDDAVRMLAHLRAGAHAVHSAVSVLDAASGRMETRVNSTTVHMRNYTDREIDRYVAGGDPMDKAGAYGIQHPSFSPVARLDGCGAGVMGLPLGDLCDLLAEFGVVVTTPLPPVCQAHLSFPCCRNGSLSPPFTDG